MIGKLVEFGLVALVAYWVSGATGIPFWMVGAAGVAIYFHQFGTRGVSGGGIGVVGAAGLMFISIIRFVVANIVFAALMLIAMEVTGVSNNYAFQEFMYYGWRWWLWPATGDHDLLLWVCSAFMIAGAASLAIRGNWKAAGTIVVVAFITIFTTNNTPTYRASMAPETWAEADPILTEKGAVPVATRAVWRFGFGNLSRGGVIPRAWNGTRYFLMGTDSSTPESASSASTIVVAEAPKPPKEELVASCNPTISEPCKVYIDFDKWKIKRDGALKVRWDKDEEPVLYPIEWDLHAPDWWEEGEVEIYAGSETKPQVRIELYKINNK